MAAPLHLRFFFTIKDVAIVLDMWQLKYPKVWNDLFATFL